MSNTVIAQLELENDCLPLLESHDAPSLTSLKPKHIGFLRAVLGLSQALPKQFLSLDASHPWMVFWSVNALALLGSPLSEDELSRVGETLLTYQHADGGFGGGPGQPAHMAATYAAVMALAHTGPRFWERIDRPAMLRWMLSLKTDCGAIRVCKHGEADPRAAYCALAVASILGIDRTPGSSELKLGLGEYLAKCQTYEGGFANEPLGEAHGGYAFCSLAALMLLDGETPQNGILKYCDVPSFTRWLVARQHLRVPGFSGRTNKLVDGCYSHWVGGCWPLVSQVLNASNNNNNNNKTDLFSREGLYNYTVKCCQSAGGGLRDKPGVRPDGYHTNYTLCGLACSQHRYTLRNSRGGVFDWEVERCFPSSHQEEDPNSVPPINPVFGVPIPVVDRIKAWTDTNPCFTVLPQWHSKQLRRRQQRHGLLPLSKEYQGFAIYVGATVALFAYLAWALLPASWLHYVHIDYYPSRWWAVAIPAWILMLMVYIYVALMGYNTERLTFKAVSPETICDKNTTVHDVPLVEVNNRMYSYAKSKEGSTPTASTASKN